MIFISIHPKKNVLLKAAKALVIFDIRTPKRISRKYKLYEFKDKLQNKF